MAATADLDDLANPLALGPGQVITETTLGRAARTQNWCHAQGGCGTMISQAWGASVFVYNGAKAYPLRWWLPTISKVHGQLVAIVRASATAAGGAPGASLYIEADSEEVAAVAVGAAPDYYELPLADVDTTGTEQLVRLGVATNDAVVSVDLVRIGYAGLSSPLAAGLAGGFTPVDLDGIDALEPLSAPVGHALLGNLDHLDERPARVVLSYSGLQGPDVAGVPTSLVATGQLFMSSRPRYNFVRLHRGLARAGRTYQVRARAWGDADRVTTLNVLTGHPSSWPNARHQFTIPAGAAWHEISEELVIEEEDLIRGVPHPTTAIGVWPGPSAAAGYSSQMIHSLAIWGP